MTTLEIIAPTNQTFTASLYERGSDMLIESLNLTENANSKGIYTGTVVSNLSGYYKVIAYDGSTPIVVTDAHFNGANTVFASDINNMDATALRDALGLSAANLDTQLSEIKSDTNKLQPVSMQIPT